MQENVRGLSFFQMHANSLVLSWFWFTCIKHQFRIVFSTIKGSARESLQLELQLHGWQDKMKSHKTKLMFSWFHHIFHSLIGKQNQKQVES
jgi:hypothetical protein